MVIVDPPSLAGEVKAKVTWRSAGVALKLVGAFDVVNGVAVTVAEAVPEDAALIALIPIVYGVPLFRLEIMTGLVVTVGLNTVQLVPPSVVNS